MPAGIPGTQVQKHPDREEIERAIASGKSIASISKKYNVSEENIVKFIRSVKLDQKIVDHADIESLVTAEEIIETVKRLMARFELQQIESQKKGDVVTSVRAGAEAGRQAERLGKFLMDFQENSRKKEQHHFSKGRMAAAMKAALAALEEQGLLADGITVEDASGVFSRAARRFIRDAKESEWTEAA